MLNKLELQRPSEDPQSALETALIEEYLANRGYTLASLHTLPEEQVKTLMTAASNFASVRLAQLESAVHLRETIHLPN